MKLLALGSVSGDTKSQFPKGSTRDGNFKLMFQGQKVWAKVAYDSELVTPAPLT